MATALKAEAGTKIFCPACKCEILRSEINNLLVDNRGAWHRRCYTDPSSEESGDKEVIRIY